MSKVIAVACFIALAITRAGDFHVSNAGNNANHGKTALLSATLVCRRRRPARPFAANDPALDVRSNYCGLAPAERPMPDEKDTLRDAVARNAGAVMSLPAAGLLRHCKTRFLAADDDGFWTEAPAGEKPLVDDLMGKATPVGVSIKAGETKIVFTTVIRQFRGQFQINKDTAVDAVLLCWPDHLKTIQRRCDYRVSVPRDVEISLRAWRIPDHHYLKERPAASTELNVSVRDLSVGGMGVVCTLDPEAPRIVDNQRLRIVIAHGNSELILEGRVKHIKPLPEGGQFRLGVQFKKLGDDIDGRQTLATLTHIVGQLQRDEIRRRKFAPRRSA